MVNCGEPIPADAPVIALILVGAGEPLLRLEKRLKCAAVAVGIQLSLEICKDNDSLGIHYTRTPAVLYDGKVILEGLPRTEEIEVWLRLNFTSGNP